MKNSAKRDAHGGQGDKDAPKTGKTGSSAEKYAQMGASGPKKIASMGPPPHPPVTQAGGTRTNPTPSGGGGTKWEGYGQPLPLGRGVGHIHGGQDMYLTRNAPVQRSSKTKHVCMKRGLKSGHLKGYGQIGLHKVVR